jgi:hypothetical protein
MTEENFTSHTEGSPFTPEEIKEYGITEAEITRMADLRKPEPQKHDLSPDDPVNTIEGDSGEDKKILGKFNSQEDLEKAYLELQKKLSKGEKDESNTDSGRDTETKAEESSNKINEALEEIGDEDLRSVAEKALDKFNSTGEVGEEVFELFKSAGIPEEMVKEYIELKSNKGQAELNSFYDSVGGEEEYSKILEWAGDNLSQEKIDAFNNVIENGSKEDITKAMKNLKAQYTLNTIEAEETKVERPKLIKADGVTSAIDGYKDQREVVRDMNSPEYETNPAFRKKVYEKLRKSKF